MQISLHIRFRAKPYNLFLLGISESNGPYALCKIITGKHFSNLKRISN
jgi:hypothetical protein